MAIYAVDPVQGHVDVMYGVVGAGTRRLSSFTVGEPLTVVGPLGRGFVLHSATRTALLLGRGIGTCSLTALAASAASGGVRVLAVDSARDSNALIADKAYREAGVDWLMQVIDADGSSDPGLVRSRLLGELDASPPEQIFVCGSNRLIGLATDLGARWLADTQVSLEAHMACGLGYCHGCSSGQRSAEREAPLICRDGPVFRWGPGPGFPS